MRLDLLKSDDCLSDVTFLPSECVMGVFSVYP